MENFCAFLFKERKILRLILITELTVGRFLKARYTNKGSVGLWQVSALHTSSHILIDHWAFFLSYFFYWHIYISIGNTYIITGYWLILRSSVLVTYSPFTAISFWLWHHLGGLSSTCDVTRRDYNLKLWEQISSRRIKVFCFALLAEGHGNTHPLFLPCLSWWSRTISAHRLVMQEWGCLGRRVCLVWLNLCAVKCMQEEICATCANTHDSAQLGGTSQSGVACAKPCSSRSLYKFHKFPFHLNRLAYSTTSLFLKTRLLIGSQHCNFINIFVFSSSVWFFVISVKSAAETSAGNVLIWGPLPMSFTWHHSLGTVGACDRQLDKHLGVSAFNLLCIPCQQQMHLICWFMELSGRKTCCCSAASHSCFGSLVCLVWAWISTRPQCRALILSQKNFKSADTKKVTFEGRGGISQTGKSTLTMLMQHFWATAVS